MKKLLILLALVSSGIVVFAQSEMNKTIDTSWKKEYRETTTRINSWCIQSLK